MNGRERFLSSLAGRQQELAAGVAYPEIPFRDHCEEFADTPWWLIDEYDPARMLPVVRRYLEHIGCDWWWVLPSEPRSERLEKRYLREGGRDFVLNTRTGERQEIYLPGHAPAAASPIHSAPVRTPGDEECLEQVKIVSAGEQIAQGRWDVAAATVQDLGRDYLIYGYTSTPFALSFAKGFNETMAALVSEPEFLRRMAERRIAFCRENFRAMAQVGVPAVFMQDFHGGAELISRRHYEEFVAVPARELVAEAHRAGLILLHYFMGNPHDRLDLIESIGGDVLLLEEGRKGYVVEFEELCTKVRRADLVLMGNLPTEGVLEKGSHAELADEVERILRAGHGYGRFIFGTGSPPTPNTPLAKLRTMTDLARSKWSQWAGLHGSPAF